MKGHTVAFDEAKQHLTPKQKAGVDTAKFLNKLGLGGEFVFFRSERINGKWMFRDSKGNLHDAPNGMYTGKDGRIYIDLNTFAGSRGATLYTLAHELTHFIENNAPEQYKVLADFLINEYDKTGKDMDARVKEKQEILSAVRGKDVSYDEAFEEVVADSMATMFTDGQLYEKLAKLKAKDHVLFNKIKAFVEKILAKFREVYADLTPDQKDAQDVRNMKEAFDRIQTAFAEALVEASENFQMAEKSTTEDGGVKYMSREDSVRIKAQIGAVADKLNQMDAVASVVTDGFVGMQKSDIAKAVEAEYAKFGKRVDRQNFGIILLEFKQINKALEYLNTDGEKAALLTVPRVLKRGIIADMHTEHKDRGIDSITFAAPVEINGIRGNVGVVVQRESGTNRFKTLRILLPNGKAFEFVQNKEADPTTGSSSKPKGSEGIPIESASKKSIRGENRIVKNKSAEPAVLKSERAGNESTQNGNQLLDNDADNTVKYSSKMKERENRNYDKGRVQAGNPQSAGRNREYSGDTLYGSGDRLDGRGSAEDKAWRYLTKKDRGRILKILEDVISKSENYGEIRMYLAASIGKPVQDMNLADKTSALEKVAEKIYIDITNRSNSRPLVEEKWKMFGSITPFVEAIYRDNVNFSERTGTAESNRYLLANALESAAQTDEERQKLQQYRDQIHNAEDLEDRLDELNRRTTILLPIPLRMRRSPSRNGNPVDCPDNTIQREDTQRVCLFC